MQVYTVDLAEWYAAGRWVALLDLIDGLPTASRYNDAIVNDPEFAAELAKLPEPAEKWAPRTSEFDLNAVHNTQIIDLLKAINHTLLAVNSTSTPTPPEPTPRPHSALEKATMAQQRQDAVDFLGQFGFDETDI